MSATSTATGFGDLGLGVRIALMRGGMPVSLSLGWTAPMGGNRRLFPGTSGGTGLDGTRYGTVKFEKPFSEEWVEMVCAYATQTYAAGIPLPAVPFLDVVTYRFGLGDPAQHFHLPFKCTPWGYSCFRGGA